MSTTYDKDPYQVLGVTKDADSTTIKKAYRKLALQHHPDRKTDPAERDAATKMFADISGAYEILTDETMRREYDREAGSGSSTGGSGGGSSGGASGNSSSKKKRPGFKFNPSDPYEVWKRDFEDQFGRPYPGAIADVVSLDTHIYQKREGVTEMKKIDKRHGGDGVSDAPIKGQQPTKKGEVLRLENGQACEDDNAENADAYNEADEKLDEGKKKKKKKGFFARLFGKKDKGEKTKKEAAPHDEPASFSPAPSSNANAKEVPAAKKPAYSKTTASSNETAMVLSSKNKKDPSDETDLALRNNENSIVEHEGDPVGHDNRPISMEVTVEEAADGSTVTTTTITRPDGTVEKCVQRTGIPGKDPKKLAQLEGEKAKLAIEDDTNKTLAIEGEKKKHLAIEGDKKKTKKKHLAIENGGNAKSKGKQTNAKGQMLLTSE